MLWLLIFVVVGSDPITIDHHAPTTRFVEFDKANPPRDVAKLHHGEDAVTRMDFKCQVKGRFETTGKDLRDGVWHVTVKLVDVRVTLELENAIYLPKGANVKLRGHEEGHAKINSSVYQTQAEAAARRAAREGLARRWEGAGTDPRNASQAAYDAAANWICDQYLHDTPEHAYRIGEIYDELTDHGTNAKPVEQAIKEAFQRQATEKD